MDVPDYTEACRREGQLFAAAISGVSSDTMVPTCPEWTVRDLTIHLGHVHRWARTYVVSGRPDMLSDAEEAELFDTPPDSELVSWFAEGHDALIAAFEMAPPDLSCWTFLRAPSPLAFWTRRQTHETGIHRVDAESTGTHRSPFSTDVAVDGIEELLHEFAAGRPRTPDVTAPVRLGIHAHDAGRFWLVSIGPDGISVGPGHERELSDCTVSASAADLYLLLWNRRPLAGLTFAGDAGVVDLWSQTIRVRWS